jgi:hypothetical protein
MLHGLAPAVFMDARNKPAPAPIRRAGMTKSGNGAYGRRAKSSMALAST